MRPRRSSAFMSLGLALALATPLYAGGPLSVEEIVARYESAVSALELTGTVEAADVVPLAFKSAGRIVSINVDVGDRVKEGDVIAELDPTQAHAALGAASAQSAAATAQLTQAQSVYDRLSGLVERGATTRASLENAEQELMAARASVDEAEAQLAKARQALADMTLRATVTGIVTQRSGEPGQVAAAREGAREAQFYVPPVPELDAMIGRKIAVRSLEDGSETFEAEISEIAPLVNSSTATISLRARIDDKDRPLALGTPISSRLEMASEQLVSLPSAALVTHLGKPAVWVIHPDSRRAEIRNVEIARFTSDGVQISKGLEEGELVAGAGSYLIYPGREVVAVEAKP
ncbi:efflux RND transporter periplasmic adaptor subunit [Aminobacter sp. J44]|uniref:efflux RND transporter periplasmic adaptor subunit n=1 Tax=Aminobacter sp. J44 TaxID=935262 RepID=UPI0011996C6B|nr:efflux RND transporter periplasmic adaptor subunit [Aminobacter sp. J44]TWG52924.1 RND family efflux transporter MFP subunit [Aminobacter sp. J44]